MSGFQKYFWRFMKSWSTSSSDQLPARSATHPAAPDACARLASAFSLACSACRAACRRSGAVLVPFPLSVVRAMSASLERCLPSAYPRGGEVTRAISARGTKRFAVPRPWHDKANQRDLEGGEDHG